MDPVGGLDGMLRILLPPSHTLFVSVTPDMSTVRYDCTVRYNLCKEAAHTDLAHLKESSSCGLSATTYKMFLNIALVCRERAPFMLWDETVRMAAARFYEQAGHCPKAAGAMLTAHLMGDGPARPGSFCKLWWQQWKKAGNVKNRGKGGRPKKVPESLARKIAKAITNKIMPRYNATSSSRAPSINIASIEEVLNRHPSLGEAVQQLNVHRKTIARAVLRVRKDSIKRKVKISKSKQSRKRQGGITRRGKLAARKGAR